MCIFPSWSPLAAVIIGSLSQAVWAQSAPDAGASPVVTRMMAFDKNSDGKLMKAEVTDERLHALFDQADVNTDGTVTREELAAVATALASEMGRGDARGGRGRGGRGPGGPNSPPELGQILPPFLRESLNLTAQQNAQLDALQKEVDEKLSQILSETQKTQLQEFRARGGRNGSSGRGL